MGFYPGSHLKVFDHHQSDAIGFSSGINKADLKDLEVYNPIFLPGDVLLHHCNIVHEAKENNTSMIRSNIAIRFYPSYPKYDNEIQMKYKDFLSKSSRFS